MYLDKSYITEQLLEFAGQSSAPLIIHSDLLKIGFFRKLKSSQEFLSDHCEVLKTLAERRPLFIASFNYEFCRTGIYDVQNSRSQVGALADFLRQKGFARTLTPIFNFSVLGQADPTFLTPYQNVFGDESVFARVAKGNGEVLLWGAGYSANTTYHHAEEVFDVGYRYHKQFKGKIVNSGVETDCEVTFRVRPRGLDMFSYDWDKQREDLRRSGVLRAKSIGNAEVMIFNAKDSISVAIDNMKRAELTYLNVAAQSEVLAAKKNHSYPFKIQDFE